MKRHLPPLNAIRVFEVAAKSESFRKTAEILFVTQSAVSKQIKLLESHLGIILFTRHGGNVRLTEHGKEYLSVVSSALDLVEIASEKFYHDQKQETLHINITPSLSALWMFSRVEDFHEQHPDIRLHISSADNTVDWAKHSVDIAIRCLPYEKNKREGILLKREKLLFIAHPQWTKNQKPEKIQAVEQHNCIGLNNRPEIWEAFFQKHHITRANIQTYFGCEHFYMVIQAVLENLGVGLVPDFLCQTLINKQQLVNPMGLAIDNEYGYYLLTPAHKRETSKVIKFSQWIRSELQTHRV